MNLLSPAIKAASAFAMGGAAFAIANLVLARNLSTTDYGQFALVIAILNLGIPLGPLGLDAVVLRHRPGPRKNLLVVSLLFGSLTGMLFAATAGLVYQIDAQLLLVLAAAILAGAVTKMCSSVYQSEQRFKWSLWLIQSQNITLVVSSLMTGVIVGFSSTMVFSALALHWTFAAVIGWLALMMTSGLLARESWRLPWSEVPAIFGYLVTIQFAAQLDKLMIPKVLDIESLATFGVLSALVLAPFKMFQAGVGYTLIPSLRGASSVAERSTALEHEAKTTLRVLFLGSVSAFVLAPWVVSSFLAGKYVFSTALIGAAVFAGTIRVLVMFVSSIVTALGSSGQLSAMSQSSWLALAASVAGGWWGAQWGLPGFIFGFALGSLARLIVAATLAVSVLRSPTLADT